MTKLLAADSQVPAVSIAREMSFGDDAVAAIQPTMNVRAAIRSLAEANLMPEALMLLARGLPIGNAVQWALDCAEKADTPLSDPVNMACLQAVRTWLAKPDDAKRRSCAACVPEDGLKTSAHWLAQAVAWSGGSLAPDDVGTVPPPPHLPATAIGTAIGLAALGEDRKEKLMQFLRAGAAASG